jgi:hypothetical protein
MIELTRRSRRTTVALACVALVAATVTAAFVAGRSDATRGPSPGVTAGVSSFKQLPPAATLPTEVQRFVQSATAATGTDLAAAKTRVVLLRRDLGSAGRAVYGFLNSGGSPCFTLTGTFSSCARQPQDGTPGLHWSIGGGYKDVPNALVGVAADDVTEVKLTIDGRTVPVSLANNIAFAEFSLTAQNAEIVIIRADGTSYTENIKLDG